MKRRILAVLLAAMLLMAVCPAALAASPFRDVQETDDCYDAVLWALDKGVTNGMSDTTFAPETICNRGQVVTFLWRAAGEPEPRDPSNPFIDVEAGSFYEKAVLWAVENGITNGTSETTFSPTLTCTCAHILTFLWRAQGAPESGAPSPVSSRFPDDYYSGAVSWAEYNGLLSGMEASFDIADPCSRGLTVTYLYRAAAGGPIGPWDPTVIQRQVIFDEGCIAGALLAGRVEGGEFHDRAYWLDYLEKSGVAEDFPFVRELPQENIVQTGGREVYLIIPLDENASVAVNEWVCDETNGFVGETGGVLYRSDRGEPILLCCNVSDAVPDTQVVIVDGDGRTLDWNPRVSLTDGKIVTVSNGEYVCDLTMYAEG